MQNDPIKKSGEYLRKMDKKEKSVWGSLLEGVGSTHLRHHSLGRLPHLPLHNKVDQKTKMMMASFFDVCSEKDEGPSAEHFNNFTAGFKNCKAEAS